MMKKSLFWKVVAVTAVIVAACDKNEEMYPPYPGPDVVWYPGSSDNPVREVNTGVAFNGGSLILLDRNIGAQSVGDWGSYLTWSQAMNACPRGYHLMTKAEATALIANGNYNNSLKLAVGNVQMPAAGYMWYVGYGVIGTVGGVNFDNSYHGYYLLQDQYENPKNPTSVADSVWVLHLEILYDKNANNGFGGPAAVDRQKSPVFMPDNKNLRQSARCVKDY